MTTQWQAPQDWQQDGSIISGVTPLKTGAWTSMLTATETKNGKQVAVVIKTFSVPPDIHQDPDRIAKEREKFLASARLQKDLADSGAKAWVDILRISENPPSFSMKKCGPSLEDLIDRRIFLSAKDLYTITLNILQGFQELFDKHKRSHGSLKSSDVLTAAPDESVPYQLADPSPKGDTHSANDLFALGQILYQLVEQKEWDPLTPIIPTKNWARFGGKRDRWIQFLNMLLSPNGCHESLALVRKEAFRLKPASRVRNLAIAAFSLFVITGAGIFLTYTYLPRILRSFAPTTAPAAQNTGPALDPQAKSDFEKARSLYLEISGKWTAREQTERYDHTASRDLARAARALAPQTPPIDTATHKSAAEGYASASGKFEEALKKAVEEETFGRADDAKALVEFQSALQEFQNAKTAWETAATKFSERHDHARSTAQAQATQTPSTVPPNDAVGRRAAADQFKSAAGRYTQALALARQEELAGQSVETAQSNFQQARSAYQLTKDRWDAALAGLNGAGGAGGIAGGLAGRTPGAGIDTAPAKALADQAKALLPEQLVLTDTASYQKSGELFAAANGKLTEAIELLEKAKRDHNLQESDVSTAVTRANEALQSKDYTNALAWYIKAANLGSAPAMFNVGLLHETGRGTSPNPEEAARWYQKAVALNHPAAMVNLALLHEKGSGVPKDLAAAMALYKRAAALNDTAAMRNIAYLYDNGIGVEKDPAQAYAWDLKAAELKDPSATYLVGVHHEQGKGVPVDYGQAIVWYTKAADLKYARAMNSLGVLHETGRGVKQNSTEALNWYKKAADLNYAPAMSNLGAIYDNGIGVPVDRAEAMKWFRKGAEVGHGMSMYNLGVLLERRGTTADLAEALDWYRKAVKSDDDQAKRQATARLNALGFPM